MALNGGSMRCGVALLDKRLHRRMHDHTRLRRVLAAVLLASVMDCFVGACGLLQRQSSGRSFVPYPPGAAELQRHRVARKDRTHVHSNSAANSKVSDNEEEQQEGNGRPARAKWLGSIFPDVTFFAVHLALFSLTIEGTRLSCGCPTSTKFGGLALQGIGGNTVSVGW
mmetsp:Transcript_41155/g.74355  ORF Transcript_41155/g.74355 Transcript_41155/m.74355 type:complete len:168 (-) Transcript_41155:59-562(-)